MLNFEFYFVEEGSNVGINKRLRGIEVLSSGESDHRVAAERSRQRVGSNVARELSRCHAARESVTARSEDDVCLSGGGEEARLDRGRAGAWGRRTYAKIKKTK